MPRGVYPRGGKSDVSQKTEPKKSTTKAAKTAAAPATASKKGGSLAALPTADPGVQFAILRENITALAHVRKDLSGSDAVAKQVERELVHHIGTLTVLRQKVFGLTTDEQKQAETPVAAVGNGASTAIPLPTNPVNLPVPQA